MRRCRLGRSGRPAFGSLWGGIPPSQSGALGGSALGRPLLEVDRGSAGEAAEGRSLRSRSTRYPFEAVARCLAQVESALRAGCFARAWAGAPLGPGPAVGVERTRGPGRTQVGARCLTLALRARSWTTVGVTTASFRGCRCPGTTQTGLPTRDRACGTKFVRPLPRLWQEVAFGAAGLRGGGVIGGWKPLKPPSVGKTNAFAGEAPREVLVEKAATALMQILHAARHARLDLRCAVAKLAQRIATWDEECDKAGYRLMCCIHTTLAWGQVGYVGE